MLIKWFIQYRDLFRDISVHIGLLSTSDFQSYVCRLGTLWFVPLGRNCSHLILEHVSGPVYILSLSCRILFPFSMCQNPFQWRVPSICSELSCNIF